MHQLTICKTPKTRGGIQKRNHTARKKHIYATCTPPMATSINSTRVHQRCHPCKNQRHKGNVWERKERAAAQLLAAVRRFPELSGRSRAAWRRRPARGCSCRSRGRWRLRGSALPEGLQPAAHVAFRSLLPKRKMRSAATWERRSPAPRAHPSSGARVPTSLGALRGHRHGDREPPSAAAPPARDPQKRRAGSRTRGAAPFQPSPLPCPRSPSPRVPSAPHLRRGPNAALRGPCAAALPPPPAAAAPPGPAGRALPAAPPPPAPRPRSPSAHAASPRRSGGPPHPGSASCPVRGAPSLATILPRAGRAAAAADAQRAKSRGSSRRLSRGSRLECRLRAETQPGGRDGGDPRIRYSVRWEFCSWQRFFCRLKPVTVGHCRSRSFTAGLRAAGARI